MWVVVGVVTIIVLAATYLTWTAARVDRLHARTAAAYAALDAQSLRRAAAAAELGDRPARSPSGPVRPAGPATVPEPGVPSGDAGSAGPAARADLAGPPEPPGLPGLPGLPELRAAAKAVLAARLDDRELAENDLTRALRSVTARAMPARAQDDRLAKVVEANRRLALARQVHNDLVRDALALRGRPLVRLLRLARRYPRPRFFDIDEPTLADSPDGRER